MVGPDDALCLDWGLMGRCRGVGVCGTEVQVLRAVNRGEGGGLEMLLFES